MPNDINELDEQDIGLKQIMGDRFEDGSAKKHRPREVYMDIPCEEDIPVDLRKVGMDFTDRLMAFCRKSVIYAAVSWACFFWEARGLMDASIAVPAMWLCAVAAGWGAGRLAIDGK